MRERQKVLCYMGEENLLAIFVSVREGKMTVYLKDGGTGI